MTVSHRVVKPLWWLSIQTRDPLLQPTLPTALEEAQHRTFVVGSKQSSRAKTAYLLRVRIAQDRLPLWLAGGVAVYGVVGVL